MNKYGERGQNGNQTNAKAENDETACTRTAYRKFRASLRQLVLELGDGGRHIYLDAPPVGQHIPVVG